MNRLPVLCLCCCLSLGLPSSAQAVYADDNPFVEAMLRMMEIFGLIDRSRLPLGVPYLPSSGQAWVPATGGLMGYPGLGVLPGLAPTTGLGALPGLGQIPGAPGWPAPGSGYPGAGGWTYPGGHGAGSRYPPSGYLDGIWELSKGGFVIIRGNTARLYVTREKSQDFTLAYDRSRLWWRPRGARTTSEYRYQRRDGRMILQDRAGNMLLLRRRR